MQKNRKLKARILSLAMSAMMVATAIPAPVFAAREGGTLPDAEASGVIISFDKLEDRFEPSTGKDASKHVYGLAVELDTPFEDLGLPTELTAMVSRTSVEEAPSEEPKEPETTEAETTEAETAEAETAEAETTEAETTEAETTEAETTEAETTEAETTEAETTEAETTEAETTEAETTEAEPTETEPTETETTETEEPETETTETEEPETEAAEAEPTEAEDEKTASTENADDSNIISAFGKTAGDFALASEETIPVTWTGNKEYNSDKNGKFIYTAELPEGYTLADGVGRPQIYVLVGRQARTGSHEHCICGGTTDVGDHTSHENITYREFTGNGGDLSEGNYYLADNVTLTARIKIASDVNVNLCLNGYKLDANNSKIGVLLNEGILNLCDCSDAQEGNITGGNYSSGGGIRNYGIFNMYGGSISNNTTTKHGGGVYTSNIFTMNGGSITDNTATEDGGGVYIDSSDGTFIMNGGSISNNIASENGGGVCNEKAFTINGGSITSNTATKLGGGVYSSYGADSFNMKGDVTISGNKKSSDSSVSNVYIFENMNLTPTGALTGEGKVGVTREKAGIFTSGTDVANNTFASYFTSDDSTLEVAAEGAQLKLQKNSNVSFSKVTANGAANTTDTTELTLTFDKDVKGLAATDITVTGAARGTLTKESGTGVYKLAISNITVAEGGNVNVAVAKTGFAFTPANKDVAVHKATVTNAITITINGTEYKGSTLEDAIGKLSGGATAVTSLKITAGEVTEVDWNYLKSLTALTSFEIDSAVTVADIPAASDGNLFPISIISVTVPQAIAIGRSAFYGCTALESVSFPEATSIGQSAFYGCTVHESVSFPEATSIGPYAFRSCAALKSTSFPKVTSIGTQAFESCNALESVSFPAATSINDEAFYNCKYLKSADFPAVTSIGKSVFSDCYALATLKLGATPPTVGTDAFAYCPATRALGYVDTDGNALTGGALTAAQVKYKAAADGNTIDGLWYGWAIALATTHTITAHAGTGGSISPSGTVTVNNGESKTFTISANSNYSISSVSVDGVSQGAITTYTFSNVTGKHTISATFSYNGGGGSSSDRQAIWTSVPSAYQGGTKIIGNVRVPDYTVEGTWKKNDNGTWNFSGNAGQVYANSWAPVFNPYANVTKGQSAFDWFKFDANGIMLTGWHTDTDGSTYYLNPNSDNTLGAMNTGWVLIDGKYYYFNETPDGTRGKLFKNARTPDGYLVDENGVRTGNKQQ